MVLSEIKPAGFKFANYRTCKHYYEKKVKGCPGIFHLKAKHYDQMRPHRETWCSLQHLWWWLKSFQSLRCSLFLFIPLSITLLFKHLSNSDNWQGYMMRRERNWSMAHTGRLNLVIHHHRKMTCHTMCHICVQSHVRESREELWKK